MVTCPVPSVKHRPPVVMRSDYRDAAWPECGERGSCWVPGSVADLPRSVSSGSSPTFTPASQMLRDEAGFCWLVAQRSSAFRVPVAAFRWADGPLRCTRAATPEYRKRGMLHVRVLCLCRLQLLADASSGLLAFKGRTSPLVVVASSGLFAGFPGQVTSRSFGSRLSAIYGMRGLWECVRTWPFSPRLLPEGSGLPPADVLISVFGIGGWQEL